jgi:hypothetical protein
MKGGFLMWEALKGKRIAEGGKLTAERKLRKGGFLKGRELLKENC